MNGRSSVPRAILFFVCLCAVIFSLYCFFQILGYPDRGQVNISFTRDIAIGTIEELTIEEFENKEFVAVLVDTSGCFNGVVKLAGMTVSPYRVYTSIVRSNLPIISGENRVSELKISGKSMKVLFERGQSEKKLFFFILSGLILVFFGMAVSVLAKKI